MNVIESVELAKFEFKLFDERTSNKSISGIVSSIVRILSLTSPSILFPALSHILATKRASPPSLNPAIDSNKSLEIETSFKSSISPFSIIDGLPKSENVFPWSKLTCI